MEVVEKLGDLSKIDISAEVTKLLTSMSQARNQFLNVAASDQNPSTPSSAVTTIAAAAGAAPAVARATPSPVPSPITDPRITKQVEYLKKFLLFYFVNIFFYQTGFENVTER